MLSSTAFKLINLWLLEGEEPVNPSCVCVDSLFERSCKWESTARISINTVENEYWNSFKYTVLIFDFIYFDIFNTSTYLYLQVVAAGMQKSTKPTKKGKTKTSSILITISSKKKKKKEIYKYIKEYLNMTWVLIYGFWAHLLAQSGYVRQKVSAVTLKL